ncbi:MAG: glutathione S-transferase family protein [Archangium sp.]
MTKPTLTYFDVPVSRGEECRLAFAVAGIPFTDERLTREQFDARRETTPYGALPVLTLEGKPPLAQSNAILRYIGSQHGLLPTDPWESAHHEAVLASVEEMRGRLGPTNRIKDPAEKQKAREELVRDYFPGWAAALEKQITGPFFGGATLSVADLKVYTALVPLLGGRVDHVPPELFSSKPKLSALFAAVKAHPKVAAWYAPR